MSNLTAFNSVVSRATKVEEANTYLFDPARINVPTTVITYASNRIRNLEAQVADLMAQVAMLKLGENCE